MKKIVLSAICACFLMSPIYCETLQEYKAKQIQKQEEFKKEKTQNKRDYEQAQLLKYKKYKTKKQQEFDAYRRSLNEKFAEAMKKKWTARKKNAAVPVPKSKEPPKPYTKNDEKRSKAVKLNYAKIVNAESYDNPEPITPVDVEIPEEEIPVNFEQDSLFPAFREEATSE